MCFLIVSEPQINHIILSQPCAVDKCTYALHLKQPNPPDCPYRQELPGSEVLSLTYT